jgi:hypothetical protein
VLAEKAGSAEARRLPRNRGVDRERWQIEGAAPRDSPPSSSRRPMTDEHFLSLAPENTAQSVRPPVHSEQ